MASALVLGVFHHHHSCWSRGMVASGKLRACMRLVDAAFRPQPFLHLLLVATRSLWAGPARLVRGLAACRTAPLLLVPSCLQRVAEARKETWCWNPVSLGLSVPPGSAIPPKSGLSFMPGILPGPGDRVTSEVCPIIEPVVRGSLDSLRLLGQTSLVGVHKPCPVGCPSDPAVFPPDVSSTRSPVLTAKAVPRCRQVPPPRGI